MLLLRNLLRGGKILTAGKIMLSEGQHGNFSWEIQPGRAGARALQHRAHSLSDWHVYSLIEINVELELLAGDSGPGRGWQPRTNATINFEMQLPVGTQVRDSGMGLGSQETMQRPDDTGYGKHNE